MSGLERTLVCPGKGAVTHVQFLQNQGLLVAATLFESRTTLHAWALNSGQLIASSIVILESEYSPISSPILAL